DRRVYAGDVRQWQDWAVRDVCAAGARVLAGARRLGLRRRRVGRAIAGVRGVLARRHVPHRLPAPHGASRATRGDVVSARAIVLPAAILAASGEAPPAGAVVATSFDELARLTADPAGPRDIWLDARTYRGDLAVKRPLAIHGVRGAVLEGSGRETVV